jgi:hypothetical protein
MDWKPVTRDTPGNGFYLVHDNGATRTMFRDNGAWKPTAVALDENGDIDRRIRVRETGVHEPTYWADIPDGP